MSCMVMGFVHDVLLPERAAEQRPNRRDAPCAAGRIHGKIDQVSLLQQDVIIHTAASATNTAMTSVANTALASSSPSLGTP